MTTSSIGARQQAAEIDFPIDPRRGSQVEESRADEQRAQRPTQHGE
jgi:hypothetical protein